MISNLKLVKCVLKVYVLGNISSNYKNFFCLHAHLCDIYVNASLVQTRLISAKQPVVRKHSKCGARSLMDVNRKSINVSVCPATSGLCY
jgi:hypothetical protein